MDAKQSARKRRRALFYMLSIIMWLLISFQAIIRLLQNPRLIAGPDAYSHWASRAVLWMQAFIGPIIILLMEMTRRNLGKRKSAERS